MIQANEPATIHDSERSGEKPCPRHASMQLSPLRLIGLVVLFALFQGIVPFLLGVYPSSDGELFYAIASIQIAVLTYQVCTLHVQEYKTHVWFFLALLILTFGMAFPVAYDELPRRLPREDAPLFLLYTIPWYWFCTFVAMSSLYLVQRVVLASILSSYRFLRGTLKFSVVNIFVSTVMVFICLTLVINVARLEYRYAMTIYVVSLLSIVLTPTAWIVLMIHHVFANRMIAIACLWTLLFSGTIFLTMLLIATYGSKLVELPVFRTLVDGTLTDRDLDCISLILIPLPIVVAIAIVINPLQKKTAVGA